MVRRLLVIMCIALIPLAGNPYQNMVIYIDEAIPIRPYENLWQAVCEVESNFDPMAYNPKEKAIGISQIRPIRINDFNKKAGKDYKHKEMYDPIKSKEVFMWYADKYHPSDYEVIAKRWNGSGYKTIEYWKRVKSKLESL